jgi:hypothetical protein
MTQLLRCVLRFLDDGPLKGDLFVRRGAPAADRRQQDAGQRVGLGVLDPLIQSIGRQPLSTSGPNVARSPSAMEATKGPLVLKIHAP